MSSEQINNAIHTIKCMYTQLAIQRKIANKGETIYEEMGEHCNLTYNDRWIQNSVS